MLAQAGVRDVVVAGRHPERAAALLRELGAAAEPWTARYCDTGDGESVAGAVAGASLVVVASPCYQGVRHVAEACLSAGADYVDILSRRSVRVELEAMRARIEASRRLAVMQGGVGVGMPALLARAVCGAVPGVRRMRIGIWISLRGVSRPEEAYDIVDAAVELEPLVYSGERWRRVARGGARVAMDFGPGFGARQCLPIGLEELRDLPERLALEELAAYGATPNWRLDAAFRGLVGLAYSAGHGFGRDVFARLLLGMARRRPAVQTGACLLVEVDGPAGTQRFRACHSDVLDWTASALAVFMRQYLEGSLSVSSGLCPFGHAIQPQSGVTGLRELGLVWERALE